MELQWTEREPILALVDTGASASAVDARRAADLPVLEESEVTGTTGTMSVEMVALEGLLLGSFALPELRATRRDLSGLLAPEGRVTGMILGSDAFANVAVTLDFGCQRLEISDGSGGVGAGEPLRLDHGIPTIEAEIGGVDTWLRIDTGASLFETPDVYVNVPPSLWESLCARNPGISPTTSFRGVGADGKSVELPVAPVAGARVGPLELERVFVIRQPAMGYFASPDARGFVGNNFLRRLGRVTLDYRVGRFQAELPEQTWPTR